MIATVTIVFHVHRIEKRLEMVPHGVNMNRTHGFFTSPKKSTTPSWLPSPESRSNTSSSRENSPKSLGDPSNQWTFPRFSGWKPAGWMPFSHRSVMGNSNFSPRMNLFWAITTSVLWQPRHGIWMDLNWNQPKFGRIYYRLTEISCSTNSGSSVVCCKSGMTGPMHSLHPSSFVKVSQVSHSYNCWNKPKSYTYTISH